MAHGSGGKASAELTAEVFGRHFKNDALDKLEDGAILDINGRIAYSTDSFVVSPLFFKGGNIGKLSICGTANDLLMMGAAPKYIACGFILEEGLDIDMLESIVISMAQTAREEGILIVAGDTKVIEGNGGLYINTSGIGLLPEGRNVSCSNLAEGDCILLSGSLGEHHACILSARMAIDNNIESDCACLSDVTRALFDNGINVRAMRDITRGGLGTILNELADASGRAMEITEKDIPVKSGVKGFCDILGLDPLYMGNEGKMVAVVPGSEAEKALAAMRGTKNGRDAALIGRVKQGSGVVMETKIGGRRNIHVLIGEGLPRIC